MHNNVSSCFAVIYIPFYALQCAHQKRVLEKSVLNHRSLDQLSLEVLETDMPKVGEPDIIDDGSSTVPAALLDHEGLQVIELNHPAETAGIHSWDVHQSSSGQGSGTSFVQAESIE